jgi:hypothetical protein
MRQAQIYVGGKQIDLTRMEVEQGESTEGDLADLIEALIEELTVLVYRKVEQGALFWELMGWTESRRPTMIF